MNRLPLILCLMPLFAQAQIITLGFTGATDVNITGSDCGKSYTGTWTWTPGATLCGPLVIWATEGDCADAKQAADVQLKEESIASLVSATTGSFTMEVSDLPAFKNAGLDAGVACGALDTQIEHKICASVRTVTRADDPACTLSVVGGYVKATQPISVLYDTEAPGAPVIESLTALDSALSVGFSVDGDTELVRAELMAAGEADFSHVTTVAYSASPVRIGGLTNGTTYSLRLVAEDGAGNRSEPSAVFERAPVQSDGFWVIYKRQGGDEQGGCHAAPASLSLMAAASVLLASLLRRKKRAP